MSSNAPIDRRPRLWIPYLVLTVSLIITFAVAAYVFIAARARDRAHFENLIEKNQLAIQRRLETYENLLRGAAGLFAAKDSRVTLKEFQSYIERVRLAERYPGIQGVGVSGMAIGQDLAGLADVMHKQGFHDFQLRPSGHREQYHAIVYLEPQDDRNRPAIGYDMFTDPVCRAAMELARDSGNAAASGKATLNPGPDADAHAGFILYAPIYFTGTTPATVEQRRKTLGGFIFSPFRVDDLLSGIFGKERSPSGIAFSVYDNETNGGASLLYQSDKSSASSSPSPRFEENAQLNIPGREWTIRYASAPDFENSFSGSFALLVLGIGGAVSVLLFSLTAAQASAQYRAEKAANELRLGEQAIRSAKDAAEHALEQAEQASELKDEFLATVSHELRTPINAVLGWSHLLSDANNYTPEELKHGLDTIERSAKAQARLIEDLLDVSRIVAGKLRLEVRSVQLGPIIAAAIASERLAADAKRVRLDALLDPNVSDVNGDPTRLQQIVWNLLSNGVKFTPSGGSVSIALRQKASDVQIIVTDSGIGISKDFLPYVFDRFRQADASTTRRHGGLGLGLGIVRHLTELHGGTVSVESAGANRGSTFTVTIPAAVSPREPEPQAAPTRSNSASLQGVHVLVVEDDPAAGELIARVLTGSGATVVCRSSVADAISVFHEKRPDVIVSDIGMPDEDGYSLIERIRAMPSDGGARIPAIALTALARNEDRQRALKAGFQVHLAKPFEPTELSVVIADLVRNARNN